MPSFDIVSEVNKVELKNAIEQSNKEVTNRFDFKGSDARIEQNELQLTVYADDEFKLKQVMDVFQGKVPFPDPAIPEWPVPDLRIRAGSAAVDAGTPLANVNDGYAGKAPDLGAYEAGQSLPVYGPRPRGVDEASAWKRKAR